MTETERRITLRVLTEATTPSVLIDWLNDRAYMGYSEQRHRRHTSESQAAYVRSFDGTPNHLWAVIAPEGFVGTITAYVDVPNRTADLGLLIGPLYRGCHYGREAWALACEQLCDHGVRKLTAGTAASNTGMRAILSATGFHEEARLVGHLLLEDIATDMVLYARWIDPPIG